jgi:hypothetical protein
MNYRYPPKEENNTLPAPGGATSGNVLRQKT